MKTTEMLHTDHRGFVSVILPVYNGAPYVREAIESILGQTYDSFELIIINDGSRDESEAIILSFHDPRIRYFKQQNQGLAATLNRAIGLAKGEYIARQDQDDVPLPQRFERQVEYLLGNPPCGMVGTWSEIWEGAAKTSRTHKHPVNSPELKFDLLFDNPFVHSSMMIRKEVFDKVGLYSTDNTRQPPEDYELWSRVARDFEVANIPEILHFYREMPGSMSRDGENPFLERLVNLSIENLAWTLRRTEPDRHISDLAALAHSMSRRVSHSPDYKEMARILREAAQRIRASSGSLDTLSAGKVDAFLRLIRTRYLKYRYGRIAGGLAARLTVLGGSCR